VCHPDTTQLSKAVTDAASPSRTSDAPSSSPQWLLLLLLLPWMLLQLLLQPCRGTPWVPPAAPVLVPGPWLHALLQEGASSPPYLRPRPPPPAPQPAAPMLLPLPQAAGGSAAERACDSTRLTVLRRVECSDSWATLWCRRGAAPGAPAPGAHARVREGKL